MPNYAKIENNTGVFDKFQYYAVDCDCRYCKFFHGKNGCNRTVCCCENERKDAIKHGTAIY